MNGSRAICHFQLAKLRVVAVVAPAVVAPSVQTLWGSSISWYQLGKKCTFSLILYLLPWIWYQNEVFNMVYEFETFKFKYLPVTLTFYTDLLYVVLFPIRLCTKHVKSTRKLIYSITFLFLVLSLWKFTFSERKFDSEFKYAIGFAVGGNVL